MRIGELAVATGLTRDTLRFYERAGLLRGVRRGSNGYRTYDAAAVASLSLIRTARELGFPLAEIAQVVPLMTGGRLGRAVVERKLRERLADLDARLGELQQLRALLAGRLVALGCEEGPVGPRCPADAGPADAGPGPGPTLSGPPRPRARASPAAAAARGGAPRQGRPRTTGPRSAPRPPGRGPPR